MLPAAALLALALLAPTAFSPPVQANSEARQQELKALRERIERLRKEIEQAQGDQAEAADDLKQSEKRISEVNRTLRELDERERALNLELKDIEAEIQRTEREVGRQREHLAELVRRQYIQGDNDALKLFLSGRNPAEASRLLEYLGYIGRARAALIEEHEASLARLRELEGEARNRHERLREVKREQLAQRQALEREKQARQKVLQSLSSKIQKQRQEVATLVRDEQRLTRLIERLARLAATPKPPPATPAAPGQRTTRLPDASLSGLDFPRLRGQLALPVAGEITARFGQPRAGGGPAWKGLFIRAGSGQDVRAVGSGVVAFADWLRGFGNLIVIDHGGGYLSLYSNNESLYKQVGERVRAGDVIASVGNTGGQAEHGLYFELRYQGRPFDPLSWVKK